MSRTDGRLHNVTTYVHYKARNIASAVFTYYGLTRLLIGVSSPRGVRVPMPINVQKRNRRCRANCRLRRDTPAQWRPGGLASVDPAAWL